MKENSTIYDVAKKTGYSPSTVARALSGNGYCAEKTKKDILKAAKQINYVPVQAAKILKSKQTKKVMFCIPDLYNPYYFSMIEGANSVLVENGYYMILVHSEHNKEREMQFVEVLREHFVDGMIMGSFHFYPKLADKINIAPVPVVLTNLYESKEGSDLFDCVYVDHTKATYLATAELIKHNHRNIVYIGGETTEQTGRERFNGYLRALREFEVAFDEQSVLCSDFTRRGGRSVMERYLQLGKEFSGVVACNDLMAVGALNACADAGLTIPDDVSFVSLDNTDYCSCTTPRLTSVNMMQYEIGKNAAEMLLEKINNQRTYKKNMVLEPSIVIRNSIKESPS